MKYEGHYNAVCVIYKCHDINQTAQIAALADCHLLIQKNVANDRTYTEIHPLDEEGRVEALARLISGDHITELSRANAREMLGLGAK